MNGRLLAYPTSAPALTNAPVRLPRRFSIWMTRQRAVEIVRLFDRLDNADAHRLYCCGLELLRERKAFEKGGCRLKPAPRGRADGLMLIEKLARLPPSTRTSVLALIDELLDGVAGE